MKPSAKKSALHTLFSHPRIGLLCTLVAVCPPVASESYTGKVVVDGVVYGDSNSQLLSGSGVMGSEKRQLTDFHTIRVEAGVNVTYRHAAQRNCVLTGDNNLLSVIETHVDGGVLLISAKQSYQAQLPVTLELSGPKLQALIQDAASEVTLSELQEKEFKLTLTGSGSVTAEGKVHEFMSDLSGSGEVNARNLQTVQARIQLSGSGSMSLTVTNNLKATISGSGEVTYYGHPSKVEPTITGSGTVLAGD